MREHPIPTDVVGYKFHIVGNMTLKQFAEIFVGVVVAVIIYNTNLIALVKWPLIILAAGSGALIAFVPIEERPLDHWITTFFKRIYNPTKFYWKKESTIPFAFSHEKREKTKEEEEFEIDLSPARRQRIKEYLSSVNVQKNEDPFEDEEQKRMQDILEKYDDVKVDKVVAKPQKVKPNLVPKVRNLAPSETITKKETENVVFQQQKKSNKAQGQQGSLSSAPVLETQAVTAEVIKPTKEFETPETEVITSDSLPFPKQPTSPNILVGMVLTPDNKLIDKATVQIKDNQGQIIQAMTTNLLGQFSLSTALPNGTYVVGVIKDSFVFQDQNISLSGKIVPPLEIRSS
jgi:hypothetical protein